MNNSDNDIFDLYRPFRNKLASFNVIDSLYVIWGYSRNYLFNEEFPSEIEKPLHFNPNEPKLFERKYLGLFDHELEFLQKEIILNCNIAKTNYSFREQKHFSKLMNYLRENMENTLIKKYTNQQNLLLDFNRMVHRQFKWQTGFGREAIFRYYQIYTDETIAELITNKFKLTPQQLFLIGFLFFGWTGTHFKTALPFKSTAKAITSEMLEIFIGHFSMTIQEAKHELKTNQQINENIFYSINPLLAKPLLIDKSDMICPIPIFIFWLVTSGIYYPLIKDNSINKLFGNALGKSFENYTGELLKKSCTNNKLKIFPEEIYGKPEKRTIDWLLIDENSILFIECKTKRMTLNSKSSLEITEGLEKDLKIMAGYVKQVYESYLEYKSNLYTTVKYDESKEFYPLILTLEDWFININHALVDKLKVFVVDCFQKANLDLELLEKFPYQIRCASDFERDIQLINYFGIKDYFYKATNNLIQDVIPNFKFVNIYEGEYQKVFVDPFMSE